MSNRVEDRSQGCSTCGRPHPRCRGHNNRGGPCGQKPLKGQKVCRNHGGEAPQAKAAVAVRDAEARARRELARVWEDGRDVEVGDPLTELARVAGEAVAFKDLLRRMVNDLDGQITQEWSDKQVHLMTPEGMREFAVIKEDMRAVVLAYERALDRCGKLLGNIVKLDLAGRLLTMRSEQAAALDQAIRVGLADVDMSVEVRKAAQAAIADRLAGMSSTVVRGELSA